MPAHTARLARSAMHGLFSAASITQRKPRNDL
jgi:hypothetical protein